MTAIDDAKVVLTSEDGIIDLGTTQPFASGASSLRVILLAIPRIFPRIVEYIRAWKVTPQDN